MLFKKAEQSEPKSTTEIVDEIENCVFEELKPLGFRKFGRTLHRFVAEDISQVIHFQTGLPSKGMGGLLCVNIGIRVPECAERAFQISGKPKKYYHEYECNIRSRLGTVSGKAEAWFDLRKNTGRITKQILSEICTTVLPVFEILCSREAILSHRREYPHFDTFRTHSILLDECMIYGRRGDVEKAKELFDAYYESAVNEYEEKMEHGQQVYLKKGQRVLYAGQDITADKDGYVTLYGANHGHIDYLDQLAEKLQLRD